MLHPYKNVEMHIAIPGGGGGGVLCYFHTYDTLRLGSIFGFKIWISIFFGVFRKMNIFGIWKFCGYFSDHFKIGLYLGVISMHLGSFLKVKVQNGGYFWGLLKFQVFLGWTVYAWPEPTYEEKMRVPPSPGIATCSHVGHGTRISLFQNVLQHRTPPSFVYKNISVLRKEVIFTVVNATKRPAVTSHYTVKASHYTLQTSHFHTSKFTLHCHGLFLPFNLVSGPYLLNLELYFF